MNETNIRKLELSDIDAFTEIGLTAYTGLGYSDETRRGLGGWLKNTVEHWPWQDMYGLFRDGHLLGGMCLFEFDMNLNSVIHKVGGIGTVAVGLLHKKEKVARDLILFAMDHYRRSAVPMVTLYPFDVAFYKKMGFGYGAQVRQFRVKPTAFPKGESKAHLEFLRPDSDRNEVLDCYNRYYAKTNGLTERLDKGLNDLFDFDENRIVAFRKEGRLHGYMIVSFRKHYDFKNDLIVKEFVYETPEALREFFTFLNTQRDQFDRVIVNTQDENFHFLLNNPHGGTYESFGSQYLETSVSGVGLMYRVVDVKQLFKVLASRNFNGLTCRLKLNVYDDFLVDNSGSFVIDFVGGTPEVLDAADDGAADAELTLEIAEFSSLIMGAVDVHTLTRSGLAVLEDPGTEELLQVLFQTKTKPMCWIHF